MLTLIKAWAVLSLLFGAAWAVTGWRVNKRREVRDEYRWWSSRVVEHDLTELPAVIRAKELIL